MHVKSQWSSTFPLWQSRISCEEEVSAQELIDQMKEWLCEEKEISPALSEEQKTLLDSLPKLSMSDERLMDLCRPWKDALILTVLGKSVNLVMMKDRIDWILRSKSFELIDLPNNYFLFKTGNSDLRLRLLFDGPWVIQGHYLAVQRWSPSFNPYSNEIQKVAVWVRIPTLPLYVYSEECLLEIGNIIGKALKVDVNTLAQCNNRNMMVERGKFDVVSVEVDLNQPLKSRFVIRSTIYTVEYEGLDLICFKCGKYGHSQEKCPLARDTGEIPLEILQSVATSSHASKNPSCGQAHLKPLVSVPGINSDDEFGSWMIAKRIPRKRILIVEPERKEGKLPENNKSNGKGNKSTSGSRFDVLQDAEDRTYSKGENRLRKSEVATTTWRRKEGEALSSIKEGVVESRERDKPVIGSSKLVKSPIVSSECGTKEVVVEKEPLNLDTDGKCPLVIGEPRLEPSSERELKEQVAEVKEREHTTINVYVDQPVILKQTTHDYNLRPNGLPSMRNKKKATRDHSVIFGSTKTIESSKASEPKVQAGGKKKSCKEKETVPDIVDSSTTTNLIEVVVRGEEDSDVLPSSLPPIKLLEHIAHDVVFTEGQESLVAETQFELSQEPEGGIAR
ncbi:hypothetical protein K1719_042643 [Acacia pycnantha]|nr:hypothetical protein K1719_042643 [Acacia pycnantha]